MWSWFVTKENLPTLLWQRISSPRSQRWTGRLTLRPHRRNTQSTVKGAPGIFIFYFYTLFPAAFLGFGYFRLWKHVWCIWIQWQKRDQIQKADKDKIDKDRPSRILVDSGFLTKFMVNFHLLYKCYLILIPSENRNAAVLFYHKPFTKIDWCNIPCSGGGCWGLSCY